MEPAGASARTVGTSNTLHTRHRRSAGRCSSGPICWQCLQPGKQDLVDLAQHIITADNDGHQSAPSKISLLLLSTPLGWLLSRTEPYTVPSLPPHEEQAVFHLQQLLRKKRRRASNGSTRALCKHQVYRTQRTSFSASMHTGTDLPRQLSLSPCDGCINLASELERQGEQIARNQLLPQLVESASRVVSSGSALQPWIVLGSDVATSGFGACIRSRESLTEAGMSASQPAAGIVHGVAALEPGVGGAGAFSSSDGGGESGTGLGKAAASSTLRSLSKSSRALDLACTSGSGAGRCRNMHVVQQHMHNVVAQAEQCFSDDGF